MDARRAEGFAEGDLPPDALGADERALEVLVRKSVRAPATLEPGDLVPLLDAFGTVGTLELVTVLGAFHFVNRIADLVDIPSDLPLIQRRWRRLRTLGVRLQALGMRRIMDLANRPVEVDTGQLMAELEAVRGAALPAGYASLRHAPNTLASLHAMTRVLPTLDAAMLAHVARIVAEALPANEVEATGFHPRPADALDALAFVGTRYVVRVTDDMVEAVRRQYALGDPELTDVFYAISVRNTMERLDRLLAAPLPPPA
jgi:hypothetical protein